MVASHQTTMNDVLARARDRSFCSQGRRRHWNTIQAYRCRKLTCCSFDIMNTALPRPCDSWLSVQNAMLASSEMLAAHMTKF